MGYETASGVVLGRRVTGEGRLWITLFLKRLGVVYVSARGAASGKVRFGGATEPLVWGSFALYQTKDSGGNFYLKSVDVTDDMLALRGKPDALFAAARWLKLLKRRLMEGHADDRLLANLYWNMKLLCAGLPAEAADWRFIWRWLNAWGLAPDAAECSSGTSSELELLRFVATVRTPELEAFEQREVLVKYNSLFADATRRAEAFFAEI